MVEKVVEIKRKHIGARRSNEKISLPSPWVAHFCFIAHTCEYAPLSNAAIMCNADIVSAKQYTAV